MLVGSENDPVIVFLLLLEKIFSSVKQLVRQKKILCFYVIYIIDKRRLQASESLRFLLHVLYSFNTLFLGAIYEAGEKPMRITLYDNQS